MKKPTRKTKERFEAWKPYMTFEDDLILKYLNKIGSGTAFVEVIVGKGGVHKWPPGSKPRRIDAVRIPIPDDKEVQIFKKILHKESLIKLVKECFEKKEGVEVIEAKRKLNRLVIGQSIVGADLLDLDYQPYSIKPVILIETGDPLLEMICERRGIRVWKS